MTTKIQVDRILLLIEELEKLQEKEPEPNFDMGLWCDLSNGNLAYSRLGLEEAILEATVHPCRTAACLAGKAGLIPAIRKLGYQWAVSPKPKGHADQDYPTGEFHYLHHRGREATREFFGPGVLGSVFEAHETIDTLQEGIDALKDFVAQAVSDYVTP